MNSNQQADVPLEEVKRGFRFRLGLTGQIVLGLILGVVVGLFFGELVAWLEVIGMIYVRGLQMTILPYIMFSLIVGFGSLSYERAWLLANRAGLLLVLFWGIGLSVVVLMTLTFPDRESASFFNPAMVEPKQEVALLEMFIPSNPFEALATSAIPAVVLFSILFGLALIGIPEKESLLGNVRVIASTLQRVTAFVVKITPIGVFGLTASAAGTLNVEDVVRLQVYFVSYIGTCIFLAFVAFPLVMSTLTPFTYLQVIRVSKDALITAFTTGNLFVVLTIMIHDCRLLFQKEMPEAKDSAFYIDILIPVTFNFPNMGKLTALLFVFFGAWFIGKPMPFSEYPSTLATGLPVFFGGIDLALPYMLQLKDLPPDLFSLYVVSGIINGRFATLLACMELLCFTLVAVTSILGKLRFNPLKIGINAAVLVLAAIGLTLGCRAYLHSSVPTANQQAELVNSMSVETRVPYEVFQKPPLTLEELALREEELADEKKGNFFTRLFSGEDSEDEARIEIDGESAKTRQVLRVGVFEDNLPWTYLNGEGELVGFDVEVAHQLAHQLSCNLEFFFMNKDEAPLYLEKGIIDILMSGVPITTEDVTTYTFTDPYLQVNVGLLVPKEMEFIQQLNEAQASQEPSDVTISYVPPSPFIPRLRASLPNVRVKSYESATDFFEAAKGKPEAFFTSAEAGSALSLLQPSYTVVLPPTPIEFSLAYPVNPNDRDFLWFMNQWLTVAGDSREMQNAYNYWILGHPREPLEPRWSIIRDVLGWVE